MNIYRAFYPVARLDLPFLKSDPVENLDAKTVRQIFNSWIQAAVHDKCGCVWVAKSKLASILRTNVATANYLFVQLAEPDKLCTGTNEPYARGPAVLQLVDRVISCALDPRREKYARYSETVYRSIRDHSSLRLLRAEYYASLVRERARLKARRIHDIFPDGKIKDELTGKKLRIAMAQFSHIRSVAIYSEIASEIWNGHIVHQDVHKVITDQGICDEDELFALCKERGWNDRWIDFYKERFPTIQIVLQVENGASGRSNGRRKLKNEGS